MSNATVAPARARELEAGMSLRRLAGGLLAMSFASLLLELALTRLFSVILFYHFAFMAISIALLGLGAGGVVAYIEKERLARWSTGRLATQGAMWNVLLILIVLEADLRSPVSLDVSLRNLVFLVSVYLVSAIPFVLTGVVFSAIFARETDRVSRLYAADLAGGALACMGVVPLLNLAGGPNTVIAAALAMAAAAAIWSDNTRERKGALAIILVLAGLIAANHTGGIVDIIYAKGMRRDQPWMEFARWNAISRIEVDDQGGAKVIVIDADASTYIVNADFDQWAPAARRGLMSAPPATANVLRPHGAYAIIGPGGGIDVARALAAGSPSITGIEINPIIVNDIMLGRYADWSAHLYQKPQVHIHISDGRSWVRNSREQFDVLQMTLVDTWASTAAGAFALSENNLYTLEAFREYFRHLKPDGLLAITRWEFKQPREALRIASQAMAALRAQGNQGDLRRNFIVISDGALDNDGRAVAVLAKKSPFTPEEEAAVRAHLGAYANLKPLYLPSAPGDNPFSRLIESGDPYGFARGYDYNVAPVTDDAPFFFFTTRLRQLSGPRGIDWKVNLGVAVLLVLLAVSTLAVALFLVLPLALYAPARHRPVRLLYFVALGLGYILVEVAFIQRFVLFLGHPVYALTVVVFLMLLASGVGSLVSRRWLSDPLRVWIPLVIVAAALAVYVGGLAPLLAGLVGLPFGVKLLVSGAALAPLGFAMGMPFPAGLRGLAAACRDAGAGDNAVEWAWAMNAAASVLGSVLAMVIAIQFGLGATLACGAAAYLAAAGLSRTLAPGA